MLFLVCEISRYNAQSTDINGNYTATIYNRNVLDQKLPTYDTCDGLWPFSRAYTAAKTVEN